MLNIPDFQPASEKKIEEIRETYSGKPQTAPSESPHGELSETEKLQFYLNKFTSFRHQYLDEIPDHILKPGDTNYAHYKCRTTWWTIISGNVQLARDQEIFTDPRILQEVKNFLEYVNAVQARRREHMKQGLEYRYSTEEIAAADAFLDKLITYLSQRVIESGAQTPPPAVA